MRLRVPLAVLSLIGGVVVGVASAVVHGLLPGLVLALVAAVAVTLALPPGWWARLPFVLGWTGVVLYLATPRPEGDYLVAGDTGGYLLLATGTVLVIVGIVTVRVRPRGTARPHPPVDGDPADSPS